MNTRDALYNFCLRLADNNLILAQRLAAWCSRGPILEEDLAMTNISLDLFGQAESMFEYAASLYDNKYTTDDLAFGRNERAYYNNLLVEQPNGDFAYTMMKQFLYSTFAKHLYEALSSSNDEMIAGLSAKALKEVKYHVRHSSEWVIRFGNGTEESIGRAQFALDELWRYTSDMFLMNETDTELISTGISTSLDDIYTKWEYEITEILNEANMLIPEYNNNIVGGHNAIHTEHLGHLLTEMQYLHHAHPEAKW
ncbi:MAG: 1,2-phenylacetyl-CoA epoxidase subunit PaaC [Bacteroidota bacterium]|nr:1,2-phenylacetyl-CoA epoxidase subunit PaaC [Bacteroidota bacterium]